MNQGLTNLVHTKAEILKQANFIFRLILATSLSFRSPHFPHPVLTPRSRDLVGSISILTPYHLP